MITDIQTDKLCQAAVDIRKNCYAPYSHFRVGAALLTSGGKIYTGVNVESASLGMTICAERNAIFHAIAEGERKLIAVAIAGGTNRECNEYCVPCGACRQVMRDFGDKESMIVLSAKTPDDYLEHTLDELLPYSFGPESL